MHSFENFLDLVFQTCLDISVGIDLVRINIKIEQPCAIKLRAGLPGKVDSILDDFNIPPSILVGGKIASSSFCLATENILL